MKIIFWNIPIERAGNTNVPKKVHLKDQRFLFSALLMSHWIRKGLWYRMIFNMTKGILLGYVHFYYIWYPLAHLAIVLFTSQIYALDIWKKLTSDTSELTSSMGYVLNILFMIPNLYLNLDYKDPQAHSCEYS